MIYDKGTRGDETFTSFKLRAGPIIQSNIVHLAFDVGIKIEAARNAIVRGNVLTCADECLILRQVSDTAPNTFFSGKHTGGGNNAVTGNMFWSNDAAIPAVTIWNLETAPTKKYVRSVMMGNHMDSTGGRGYQSFRGDGVTAGGDIGDTTVILAYKPHWIFCGNNAQGTLVGTSNSDDMAHNQTNKSLVLNTTDDITPVNNV